MIRKIRLWLARKIAPPIYMYNQELVSKSTMEAYAAYADSAFNSFKARGGRMATFRLYDAQETVGGSNIIFRWRCEIDRNDRY